MRTPFRGLTVRQGLLMEGPSGWAEFSPFPEYDDVQSLAWWHAAQESATEEWPAPVRDQVPVNATVPAVHPSQVPAVLRAFPGCTTAKVKVAEAGHPPAADEARLAAVRAALGPAGRIRVDANGAWDVETATRLLPRYDRAAGGLEYAEQPCGSAEELAQLRRRVGVRIAVDESIRRADDPLRVARLHAADVVVLKVQPLGGVRACLRLAEQVGVPVVVSSALETSIGIAAGVALAAALPELPYACGLATVGLLEHDVVADPLVAVDGMLPVRRPEPDPAALAASRADAATTAWWRDRAGRIARLA
ncbi:MAG: o-succinylbenzoate synthase [Jiangellaceae bacterium]|nr:o-succinylbenzoate synthase [Jiangellaceae bacterium]